MGYVKKRRCCKTGEYIDYVRTQTEKNELPILTRKLRRDFEHYILEIKLIETDLKSKLGHLQTSDATKITDDSSQRLFHKYVHPSHENNKHIGNFLPSITVTLKVLKIRSTCSRLRNQQDQMVYIHTYSKNYRKHSAYH